MAADPTLVASARGKVTRDGLTGARAVWEAADEVATMLASLGGYMAERARDVHDVRDRLVAELTGRAAPGVPVRAEPFVLVALDLAPADTATLDPSTTLALVTEQGGPTSHTAILAKALGLPAVVAATGVLAIEEGTLVLVDGSAGTVVLEPDAAAVAKVQAAASVHLEFDGQGRTADGHRVALLANVGDATGVAAAVQAKAEGVGLFRTEFCFLDRSEAPSIDEQVRAYREVLAAFPGKKVVVRTLDAGADKPLPFLTSSDEENPALGVRGLRTAQRSPQVLADQLTAIGQAQAQESAEVWVMNHTAATSAHSRLAARSSATPEISGNRICIGPTAPARYSARSWVRNTSSRLSEKRIDRSPIAGFMPLGMRTDGGSLSPPRSSVRNVTVRPPTLFSAATACAYCSSSEGRSVRSR
jgi:phosphotransferase system enzyme I (PtsI)